MVWVHLNGDRVDYVYAWGEHLGLYMAWFKVPLRVTMSLSETPVVCTETVFCDTMGHMEMM